MKTEITELLGMNIGFTRHGLGGKCFDGGSIKCGGLGIIAAANAPVDVAR